MKDIFRKGDRVFHIQYGWGKVNKVFDYEGINVVECKFIINDRTISFIIDNKLQNLLSFTEYSLCGFSDQRPEQLPKKGQVVWVRDRDDQAWYVSMFWGYDPSEPNGPYIVTPNFYEGDHECYRFMTTKNPYENEQ